MSAASRNTLPPRLAAAFAACLLLLCAGAAPAQDADGDRLPDSVEAGIGTDPTHPDSDGDGDHDWLEYYRCRSPLDANDRGPARCRGAVGGPDGGWAWSENGPVAGMHCLRITNAVAPAQWADTHLCTTSFTGWRWSDDGPIAGLSCTAWRDPADPAWNNDLHHLCGVVDDAPWRRFPSDFAFVTANLQQDADAGVRLANAAAPATWSDNYFCQRDDRVFYEEVACLNCGTADLANGALLSVSLRRTTGEPVGALVPGTTVDGEACAPVAPVAGQPLQCRLPAGRFGDLGRGRLLETLVQRLAIDFPAPVASSVTPASLRASGGSIVVEGQNFGIGAATVTVGGQACTVLARTPTAITCQAPPRPQGNQPVVVTVGNQSSNLLNVAYRAAPTVSGISVSGAAPTAGGGQIVVLGSGLDDAPSLFVGGAACTPEASEPGRFACRMPPGRGTAVPVAFFAAGVSFAGSVDYDPPTFSAVVGEGGPTTGGTVIGVLGNNFGNETAGVVVTVGGAACTFGAPGTGVSHGRIDCVLPPGQGSSAPLQVSVLGRQAQGILYGYRYAPPSVEPFGDLRLRTAGGDWLEVRGSNLGTSGSVRIGGIPCRTDVPGASHSHTLIRCLTPEGIGTEVLVRVDVADQSTFRLISYRAPTIIGGLWPPGPTLGGDEITMTGTDLGGTSLALPRSVRIGSDACEILEADHSFLRCRVPPGAGAGLAVVATIGGQASNALSYDYRAPVVTDVVPGTLPTAGQVEVTVRGRDFGRGPTIRIGEQICQLLAETGQVQATCLAPPRSAGTALLRVEVAGQASNSWSLVYDAAPVAVALAKAGDGFGSIASVPGGLACDEGCTARDNMFPRNASITLVASPAPGSVFFGWQGPCVGRSPTCTFTASADVVVTARFGTPLFESGFEPGEGD